MKKLISIFGALALSTSAIVTVSCIPKAEKQSKRELEDISPYIETTGVMAQNIILSNNNLIPNDKITNLDRTQNQVINLDYSTGYQIGNLDLKYKIKTIMGSVKPSDMDINSDLLKPIEGAKEITGTNETVDLLGVVTSVANLLLGKDFDKQQADFIVTTLKSVNQMLRNLLVPNGDISSMKDLVKTIDGIASQINTALEGINSFQDILKINNVDVTATDTFGKYVEKVVDALSNNIISLLSGEQETKASTIIELIQNILRFLKVTAFQVNQFMEATNEYSIQDIYDHETNGWNPKDHVFSEKQTNLEISNGIWIDQWIKENTDKTLLEQYNKFSLLDVVQTFTNLEILDNETDSEGYSVQRITAALFAQKNGLPTKKLASPVSLLINSLLKNESFKNIIINLLPESLKGIVNLLPMLTSLLSDGLFNGAGILVIEWKTISTFFQKNPSFMNNLLDSIKISTLINLLGVDIHKFQFLYGIQDLSLLDILNTFSNHFGPDGYKFDFDTIIELLKTVTNDKFKITEGAVTTSTSLSSLIVALVANNKDNLTLTKKDANEGESTTKEKLLETIFMGEVTKPDNPKLNPFEEGTIAHALSKIYGHTKDDFNENQSKTVVNTFKGLSDLFIYLKGPATQKYVDDYLVGYFDQNLWSTKYISSTNYYDIKTKATITYELTFNKSTTYTVVIDREPSELSSYGTSHWGIESISKK